MEAVDSRQSTVDWKKKDNRIQDFIKCRTKAFKKISTFFISISLIAVVLPSVSLATDNIPIVSRDSIIEYAKSGVGSPYVWGGDTWDPNNRKWGGADCSGYVQKCWMIPKRLGFKEHLGSPRYNTDSFYNRTYHWYPINRSEMVKADAFVRRDTSGGHIMIYDKGDPWGQVTVYEARGKAWGIIHNTRDPLGSNYKSIRRNNLSDVAPRIIASAKLPNGSYITAQPASWAQSKMYFDNTDALNDFYITNVFNLEDIKSVLVKNSKASISISSNIRSFWGLSFSRNIQKNQNSSKLRHASGLVTSSTGTLASAKSSNGYIYQAVPKQFVYSKLGIDLFRTDLDTLFITNPTSSKVRTKIYLYDAGRKIAYKQLTLNPLQVRAVSWKRDKKVLARPRKVYMEINASRSIMASRRLPTLSCQQARPLKYASSRLYFEYFNPKSEVIYLANPSPRVTAKVSIILYNNGKNLYSLTKKICPRDVIGINLNKTAAGNYQNTGVKIISHGTSIIGSKRLPTGHFQNAYSQPMLSQKVLLERYDPATEPVFVANPNQSSISLQVKFYKKGLLVCTKKYSIGGGCSVNINFSTEPSLKNYHQFLVQLTSGY